MLFRKHNQTRGGFTIGEVVLSSFILSFGLTTVISLIGSSFRTTVETERLIMASELAQEGIELTRNIRDNALVDKVALDAPDDVFVNFPNGANQRCVIDYTMNTLSCPGSPDMQLGLSGGFYRHGTGSGLFYRLIKISHTAGGDEATVTSFVAWQDPGVNLNGGGAKTWCTIENKCVYSEILLTQWQ